MAERLAAEGFAARAYHAGMEDVERTAVQEWFMQSTSGIVVATIAFGMGIDKSDIRYVYHYNLPKSLENYSQEIGRAGRDGKAAVCEVFVCGDDLDQLENFAYGDTPSRTAIERLLESVFSRGTHFDVSYHELAAQSDIRLLVVRTLLTYLELDGFLAGGTPFYSTYKFRPHQTSSQILSHFQGERRQFLERLFRLARKGKTWFQVDLDRAAETMAESRERIVRALDYLAERGSLELQATGTRQRYERLRAPQSLDVLTDELYRRAVAREQQEIGRLHQVLEFAGHFDCQVNALCRHFGETPSEPCGHCTRCLYPDPPREPPPRRRESIDPECIEQAMALRREHPEITDPVVWARLLCGIASPAFSHARLTSHPLFGACAAQRFTELRERFENETA